MQDPATHSGTNTLLTSIPGAGRAGRHTRRVLGATAVQTR